MYVYKSTCVSMWERKREKESKWVKRRRMGSWKDRLLTVLFKWYPGGNVSLWPHFDDDDTTLQLKTLFFEICNST